MTADQRCACGVTAASGAPRCRSCPLAGSAGFADPAGAAQAWAARPLPAYESSAPLMTYSRWKKSAGTFGPTGRIVATLLLMLPLPVFAAAIATGFGIIGGGIYIIVVMPWALRDIWKRAATPIEAPDRVVTPVRF